MNSAYPPGTRVWIPIQNTSQNQLPGIFAFPGTVAPDGPVDFDFQQKWLDKGFVRVLVDDEAVLKTRRPDPFGNVGVRISEYEKTAFVLPPDLHERESTAVIMGKANIRKELQGRFDMARIVYEREMKEWGLT